MAGIWKRPDDGPEKHKQTKPILLYLIYDTLIFVASVLAVAFSVSSAKEPVLYSFEAGQWINANPKISTIIWTACGTIASALLLFLLSRVLHLMAKQSARAGATLSAFEGWSQFANYQPLWDIRRCGLSIFTIANWLVALALTTAFTTLFTPTRVLLTEALVGDEINFESPEFWKWYETRDGDGVPVRKLAGCERYTYTSPTGTVRFPTCPFADDPVGCVSAGVAAAQQTFGVQNSSIRVVDSVFNGSTGGILPLGLGGIPAFSNVGFRNWHASTWYPQYNYTLDQQGLSAVVSCESTPVSPIVRTIEQAINVTNAGSVGKMQLASFRVDTPDCVAQEVLVVSAIGTVASVFCQEGNDKKYQLHLAPYDKYAAESLSLPNLTCFIEPVITRSLASYSTATGMFTQSAIEISPGSSVPNETVEAVAYLFMNTINGWGNGLVDSILSLNTSGDSSAGAFSYPTAVEAAIRGFIEYEGTNLRMTYIANEAPGRISVNGNYSVMRVGYNQTQPTTLALLLPLLSYVVLIAGWYTWRGLSTGAPIDDGFDPTNSIALVAATADGSVGGRLRFGTRRGFAKNLGPIRRAKVKYEGQAGLVNFGKEYGGTSPSSGFLATETSYGS